VCLRVLNFQFSKNLAFTPLTRLASCTPACRSATQPDCQLSVSTAFRTTTNSYRQCPCSPSHPRRRPPSPSGLQRPVVENNGTNPAIVDKDASRNHSGDNLALENGLLGTAFGMAYMVIFLSALGISPWLHEKIDRFHGYIPRVLIQTVGIGGFAGYYTWKLINDWTAPLGTRLCSRLRIVVRAIGGLDRLSL